MNKRLLDAHNSIDAADDLLSIGRDNAWSKEDEEQYNNVMSDLYEAKSLLDDLQKFSIDLINSVNAYLTSVDDLEKGRSPGQPLSAFRNDVRASVRKLARII